MDTDESREAFLNDSLGATLNMGQDSNESEIKKDSGSFIKKPSNYYNGTKNQGSDGQIEMFPKQSIMKRFKKKVMKKKFLVMFFLTNVLLPFVDVLTDVLTGLKFLAIKEGEFNYTINNWPKHLKGVFRIAGFSVFFFIMLPFLALSVKKVYEVMSKQTWRKITWVIIRDLLWDLLWEAPGFTIIRKFGLFMQLVLMDTSNPANFLLIDKISRDALIPKIYEAMLESAPQFVIQSAMYMLRFFKLGFGDDADIWCFLPSNNCAVESLFISFVTLSLTCTKLFFYLRIGIHSDVAPKPKILLFVCPVVALYTLALFFNWIFYALLLGEKTFFWILTNLIISAIFFMSYVLCIRFIKPNTIMAKSNVIITGLFVAIFAPLTVLFNNPFKRSYFFLMLCFLTFVIHSSFYLCDIFIWKYSVTYWETVFKEWEYVIDNYNTFFIDFTVTVHTIATFSSLFVFLLCGIILHFLSDYHNIYKLSQFCCCKPIIHRSMIYDYLVDPNMFNDNEEENESRFFREFLKEKKQLNIPDEKGDTVLHYAFQMMRWKELEQMIVAGGNPFIKNKLGVTIEMLIKKDQTGKKALDSEVRQTLVTVIAEAKNKLEIKREENAIHKATRKNKLKYLKVYRQIGASFDHYNWQHEKPIEIAMKNDNLEMSLYIMCNSDNVFDDDDLAYQAYEFIYQKLVNEEAPDDLIDQYSCIFGNFIDYSLNSNHDLSDCEAGSPAFKIKLSQHQS